MSNPTPPSDWRPIDAKVSESMRGALDPGLRVDVDAAWKKLSDRIELAPGARVLPFRPRRRWMQATALAAGLLIAAVGVNLWLSRAVELSAPPGQRMTRTLDDGSVVTLNAGSRIRYSRRFASRRDIQLEGEALFVVKHDAKHPFRVRAAYAVATDLGTRFVVRAYPELGYVDLGVTEGRVSLARVGNQRDSVVVTAGMFQRMYAQPNRGMYGYGVPSDLTSWVDGRLVFDSTALADVAAQLRRKYGVAIRFADTSLGERRVTATIANETLTQAFDAISLALGITYQQKGDTVVISR